MEEKMQWYFSKHDPWSMDGLPDRWVGTLRNEERSERHNFTLTYYKINGGKKSIYRVKVQLPVRAWSAKWFDTGETDLIHGSEQDALQAALQHANKLIDEASVWFDAPARLAADPMVQATQPAALLREIKALQEDIDALKRLKQILPTLKHEGLPFGSSGVKP